MIKTKRFLGAIAACAIAASGCVPTGDGRSIPIVPIGGGGSSGSYRAPAKSPPIAPPVYKSDSNVDESQYERHGVTDPNSCYAMEKRFLKEGRKVRLFDIVRNKFNKGGGVLEYTCLFEGEDAQVENTNVFDDYRYNSRREYE
ncbi:hypothetical protein [cf. Phormidesmis sp. LEGE 11477]|uniref:hypothetical protein n=1 Tax=cf. Phormidesmis sp. LEGE 11477 TaxID=1828680 RepID=UPI0018805158|nr:hypothetical protein [cf. Phormidesmis sp. LEGE 11477]MBE9064995.1 hypothetical protein [cf. Phormidesmis sp. LEGE 11477]